MSLPYDPGPPRPGAPREHGAPTVSTEVEDVTLADTPGTGRLEAHQGHIRAPGSMT